MPRAKLIFHPGAAEDYEEAFAWYVARGAALAADFEREVERCLRLIAETPLRWPKFDAERHRMIVRKFLYSIAYEVIANQIVILAVAHGRRRPYYWRARAER